MPRACVIVLDAVGAGDLPDASEYGTDMKVCKISVVDSKSSRPWGTYQKLADEFGVGLTTTVVAVSYDRYVMALLSNALKRDDFMVMIKNWKSKNDKRIKEAEACETDCQQVEKWLGEKKYADATSRPAGSPSRRPPLPRCACRSWTSSS